MQDDWVTAAFLDDSVVAELLFRLKQSSSMPPKPPPSFSLPFGWGHRQPRSKAKKDLTTTTTATTTTRCSPTTPLSWSGGDGGSGSPSDGVYEYDSNSNSSRPSSDPSRSKGGFTNDTGICSNTKKSKKKKTFTELKEEESLLLKERVTLKRELASLHVTFEEQRTRRENLKRIKIDLNLQTSAEMCGTSCGIGEVAVANQCNRMEPSMTHHHPRSPALPRHAVQQDCLGSCRIEEKEVDMQENCFVLPDLNMMPSEEEIGPEILNGVS